MLLEIISFYFTKYFLSEMWYLYFILILVTFKNKYFAIAVHKYFIQYLPWLFIYCRNLYVVMRNSEKCLGIKLLFPIISNSNFVFYVFHFALIIIKLYCLIFQLSTYVKIWKTIWKCIKKFGIKNAISSSYLKV